MNDNTRHLLRSVCEGDIKTAQAYTRVILNGITTQKDASFRDTLLRKLDAAPRFIELPANLKSLLVAEDSNLYPISKYYFRERDKEIVNKVLDLYRASERLAERGIEYVPAVILEGESGCGKTELARYIAHRANLPFIYVKFSSLLSSYLGSTQSNIAKIFDYARTMPCVLCFDEIDAIGLKRGQDSDVGEMSRIVIALMQEMDRPNKHMIVIGTTNRYDRLDPALSRRFTRTYTVVPLDKYEQVQFAETLFHYAGISPENIAEWCGRRYAGKDTPASTLVKDATEFMVQKILEEPVDDTGSAHTTTQTR